MVVERMKEFPLEVRNKAEQYFEGKTKRAWLLVDEKSEIHLYASTKNAPYVLKRSDISEAMESIQEQFNEDLVPDRVRVSSKNSDIQMDNLEAMWLMNVLNLKRRLVYLQDDGVDMHQRGCTCGLCDNANRSFSVGVYEFDCPCGNFDYECDHEAMTSQDKDPIDRVYRPSVETAFDEAEKLCECAGYEIACDM